MKLLFCALLVLLPAVAAKKAPPPSPLDLYIEQAMKQQDSAPVSSTPGSLYRDDSPMSDMNRDLRARFVNDMVTILVAETASAVASGDVQSSRSSSAKASVSSVLGPKKATSALGSLLDAGSESNLDGKAATSRTTTLSTTLAARVTHVLPNGFLVVQGTKEVQVNSDRQIVTIRGVARPNDIAPGNLLRSDRLAQMEVRINGKGVVGDAIRRPNFIYRILLGLLPF